MVAVPTETRVRLWDVGGPRQLPALTGPVARSTLRTVRWLDRQLLLTGSQTDETVALWDLNVPVEREQGHEERIADLDVVESDGAVVSVDVGGTIVCRDLADGRRLFAPLATDVEPTRALGAWSDGSRLIAAIGTEPDMSGTVNYAAGICPPGNRWDLLPERTVWGCTGLPAPAMGLTRCWPPVVLPRR